MAPVPSRLLVERNRSGCGRRELLESWSAHEFALSISCAAQAVTSTVPRAADGKPDLNGIWQALNEANYDIEAHVARPAMALRGGPYGPVPAIAVLELGAVGAVPPGLGVLEGVEIPYNGSGLSEIVTLYFCLEQRWSNLRSAANS